MKIFNALFIVIFGTVLVAAQNIGKESKVSNLYGSSAPGQAPQSYSAQAPQSYAAQGPQSYSPPASVPSQAPQSYSAPATIPAPIVPSYSAPLRPPPPPPAYFAPVSPSYAPYTPPPCQRNFVISCQPALRPVACSAPRPYGSIGAYSEYIPAYISPSAVDYD